jgi:hypothetical protein
MAVRGEYCTKYISHDNTDGVPQTATIFLRHGKGRVEAAAQGPTRWLSLARETEIAFNCMQTNVQMEQGWERLDGPTSNTPVG